MAAAIKEVKEVATKVAAVGSKAVKARGHHALK